MDGQMLTEGWFRCDRTLAQSPVSSFDQGEVVWLRPDAERKVTGRWVRESGQL